MLHSPERHQPLTDRAWDEGWVEARVAAIADDAEAAVAGDGLWAEHPDDHDDGGWSMPKTVYMGAAGVVWGLHALGRDHPQLIRGLHASYLREPDWPEAVPAYLAGEAGILLVQLLLEPDPGTADLLEAAVRGNAGNETNELLWGAPGTMLAALHMHRVGGEQRWADAWLASADELWARWLPAPEAGCDLWTQRLYGSSVRYIGPGHGFAGNVRSLWLGRRLLDGERAAELERRAVTTSTALAVREQGLANWPPSVGPLANRGRIRTQWCHGAPGMVSSLAEMAPDDDGFTRAADRGRRADLAGRPAGRRPRSRHGTAGNGIAFLALHQRTGDERWLQRARRFAVHALEQVEHERAEHGRGRHSLWTGDIGAAVMARSCMDVRPGMPTLDWV